MRPRHEQQYPTRRAVLSSIQRSEAGSVVVSQPVARDQDTYGVPAGAHCRDWSTAGRIEGGQSAPRFGSVARSPHTGRGSDRRPVQFRDWSILPGALCGCLGALAASGLRVTTPVPSHGANERLGLIRNPLFVLPLRDNPRGEVGGEFGGRIAVRLRVAGTAIRCDVLGAPPARGVLEKLKLVFRRVFHALKHGVEHEQCGQQKLRNGSPR